MELLSFNAENVCTKLENKKHLTAKTRVGIN